MSEPLDSQPPQALTPRSVTLRRENSASTRASTNTSRSLRRLNSHAPIHRMYSAGHLNDASVYHAEDDEDYSGEETNVATQTLSQTPRDESRLSRFDAHRNSRSSQEHPSDPEKPGRNDSEEQEEHESPESPLDEPVPAEDFEKAIKTPDKPRSRAASRSSRKGTPDPNLVTWEGPGDPANPKNWTMKRKWAATVTVSLFTFISPVSSSMVAPALLQMGKDLHATSTVEEELMLSIFVLAYAVGPLFLGPLSELYGRVIVLQTANLFYLVWNLACGFAQTTPQMLIFRFLAGLGGSGPLAIGGGVLSDCWRPEQRGRAISAYSLAPLLGPAVGPIAGGFISEKTTWRWVFWATCIADVAIQVFGLFMLQETYAPTLLQRKRARLERETGNTALYTERDVNGESVREKLVGAFERPFRMILTQPIIQVIALYMAYLYGLCYLVLATFPTLWTDVYHENVGIGGLNYISLGLGFFGGAQLAAPFNDATYRRLKARNGGVGLPEFRCPVMIPGAILVPIGLFWYGWSADAKLHWIMPNVGAALFGAGIIIGFQIMQTYIVDAYTTFAASGIAAVAFLRSLAGFGFPLFAPAMYQALGLGWGNSMLGFIAVALGIPGPFLLWKYGAKLRAYSPFASG